MPNPRGDKSAIGRLYTHEEIVEGMGWSMAPSDQSLENLVREAIPIIAFHRPNGDLHKRMARALGYEWTPPGKAQSG